jgi:hypothetical protein
MKDSQICEEERLRAIKCVTDVGDLHIGMRLCNTS